MSAVIIRRTISQSTLVEDELVIKIDKISITDIYQEIANYIDYNEDSERYANVEHIIHALNKLSSINKELTNVSVFVENKLLERSNAITEWETMMDNINNVDWYDNPSKMQRKIHYLDQEIINLRRKYQILKNSRNDQKNKIFGFYDNFIIKNQNEI